MLCLKRQFEGCDPRALPSIAAVLCGKFCWKEEEAGLPDGLIQSTRGPGLVGSEPNCGRLWQRNARESSLLTNLSRDANACGVCVVFMFV